MREIGVTIKRKQAVAFLAIFIALLCFLFLRNFLLLVYLPLVFVVLFVFRQRISLSDLIFIAVFCLLGLTSALSEGIHWPNYLFSIYLLLPTFLIIRSVSGPLSPRSSFHLDQFMKITGYVLIAVNISAFIYYFFLIDPSVANQEDSFTGFYGKAGFGSHSLSIINMTYALYAVYNRRTRLFFFFLFSGIMGFYGLGLMVLLATLGIMYFSNLLRYFRQFIVGILGVVAVGLIIATTNAKNFNYIEKNLSEAFQVFEAYDYEAEKAEAEAFKVTQVPRFITFVYGSVNRLLHSPKVLLLGASPGGYNSRVAFYFNGDFVQNEYLKYNYRYRTRYHSEDVFPLLNWELLKRPYNDGTRNQTFSSVLAVIMEYGIIAGAGFLLLIFSRAGKIRRQSAGSHAEFLRFLSIYLLMILLVQNYLEYPEVIMPIALMFKMAEMDNRAKLEENTLT